MFALAGCPTPPSPPKNLPPPASLPVAEPTAVEVLRASVAELERRDHTAARISVNRFLVGQPEHLEARVLLAAILEAAGEREEAAKSWRLVERTLVYQGKLVPFEVSATLQAAALHYARAGTWERVRVFLDELWRRFPLAEDTARTQLAVAEVEAAAQRWTRVVEACRELIRIRGSHPATTRCQGLTHAARRMLDLGPAVDAGAPRWAWEHPLPQGNTLRHVWVTPAGDVFAVGAAGTILHRARRDRAFTLVPAPARWPLHRLWGAAPDELYAVGAAGIVLRFDGQSWSVARPADPTEPDLWGVFAAAGRVVAVGDGGAVVERAGSGGAWTRRQAGNAALRGVWGTGDTLYAVGDAGTLLRALDGRWSALASDCYEDLWAIWGGGEKQLIAAGNRRTLLSFDGEKAKETIAGRTHFRDVWGRDGKQLWAVGTAGDIVGYTPRGGWRAETAGTLADLHGLGGRGDEVWAVGEGGTILQRRNRRWSLAGGGGQQELVAVAAAAGYALGERGLLLRRGKGGRWQTEPPLPVGRYRHLWSDGSRLIAVGDRGLVAVRGAKGPWKIVPADTPEDLFGVWGGDGVVVAVGTRGTIVRLTTGGAKATRDPTPTGLDLRSVWGLSAKSIFAVGTRGVVLRFDGERWMEQDGGTLADLRGVWGTADAVVAVGSGGVALTLEKGRWRAVVTPLAQDLVGVWGNPRGYYAVSTLGGIVHFDGQGWRVQSSPAACLRAVHGDPLAETVLAVGCHGTVLRLPR